MTYLFCRVLSRMHVSVTDLRKLVSETQVQRPKTDIGGKVDDFDLQTDGLERQGNMTELLLMFSLVVNKLHVLLILIWTHYLFSDWTKAHSEFSNLAPVASSSCILTIILRSWVPGNHVMYDGSAWFLRVIMSSLCTLCCWPSVKKQKHDINETISFRRFSFCDIQNNQGLGRDY